MPWIELHQNLLRHPKLTRLASRLGVSKQEALWSLLSLWLWALDYAQKGDLSNFGNAEIADAADWKGDPKLFVESMQDSKWLDGNSIHDWMDYAGRLVEQREANKERMRAKRASHVQNTTDERVTHVGGLPNQPTLPTLPTKPDLTALALEVVKAYPDQAKKDGRPIQKGINAQSLSIAAIKKRPDHPWVEHATLVRELVDMPYNLDKWLREFSDEASLEALRKSKTANKSKDWVPPHMRPL